jgi:hypothetical protein
MTDLLYLQRERMQVAKTIGRKERLTTFCLSTYYFCLAMFKTCGPTSIATLTASCGL